MTTTTYIVTFQTSSEESRLKVTGVLKTYASYCPIHDYCWAIKTIELSTEILNKVMKVLSPGERAFVIRSGTEASWVNTYSDSNSAWLKGDL